MNLEEKIKKLATVNQTVTQSVRNEGRVELRKSLLCEILRTSIPELPSDKFVLVGTEPGEDSVEELSPLIVTWDEIKVLDPATSAESQPSTPAHAPEKIAEQAKSVPAGDLLYVEEYENRRFRYFYVLDGVFSNGNLTYEELRNLRNTGGFLGDFPGLGRDVFSNIAEICGEFLTGLGIILRIKDA